MRLCNNNQNNTAKMNFLAKLPSNYKSAYPTAGKVILAGSGVMFLIGIERILKSRAAEKEIQYRKSQLQKPVYRLSEEEYINPPWNKGNLQEWMYRRVEVCGKVVHTKAMMLESDNTIGYNGYEYVVPLIAKEDEKFQNQQGLIVSKGWIPWSMRKPGLRYRVENFERQRFVGFVSQLAEYQKSLIFEGNATSDARLLYNSADCEDFAVSSGFINRKQAGVAVVEELHQTGVLNERDGARRAVDAAGTENYPYAKTESGALQLPKMPWHYQNESKQCFFGGLVGLVVGASIF